MHTVSVDSVSVWSVSVSVTQHTPLSSHNAWYDSLDCHADKASLSLKNTKHWIYIIKVIFHRLINKYFIGIT